MKNRSPLEALLSILGKLCFRALRIKLLKNRYSKVLALGLGAFLGND